MSPSKEEPNRTPRDFFNSAMALSKRAIHLWPVVAAFAAIGVVAALLVPRTLIKPVYQSETVLLYRQVIQTGALLGPDYRAESSTEVGQRLREMLLARPNLESIVRDFDLYPGTVKSEGIIEAVDEMRRNIDARVRQGETFYIQFRHDDASKTHAVTKRLADSLVEQSARHRQEESSATMQFLQAQMQSSNDELKQKEQEMAQFLAQHPEFAQDVAAVGLVTAGASVRAAEKGKREAAMVKDGDPTLMALRRQAIRLRRQIEAPGEAPPPMATGPEVSPQMRAQIEDARRDLTTAQKELSLKEARYTPQHPDVITARARLQATEARLQRLEAQASAATSPYEAPLPAASPEEHRARLEDQLRRVNAAIGARQSKVKGEKADASREGKDDSDWIVALETQWSSLNRQLNELRERNAQMQTRFFRASIVASVEASGNASQMIIIDPAYMPNRPARFGSRRVGAAAAFVSLMLGMSAAIAGAFMTDRVYDETDIRRLGIGSLAHAVPRVGRRRKGKKNG